jgi:ribosomal protein L44E
MGSSEGRVMLQKYWKLEPPLNKDQHTKQVLHGNQKKLYYWCKCHKSWTIHSPVECRKQLENLEEHIGNQFEEEQTTIYNQNLIQAQELNRMNSKKVIKFTCPVKQGKLKSRRNGDTSMNLEKCNQ